MDPVGSSRDSVRVSMPLGLGRSSGMGVPSSTIHGDAHAV
jgi:hypothetical protein